MYAQTRQPTSDAEKVKDSISILSSSPPDKVYKIIINEMTKLLFPTIYF